MTKTLKKYAASAVTAVSTLAAAASPALAQITVQTVAPDKGYANDFGQFLNAILTFVMVIAALLVFLYLIWGGISWITAGEDKGKTQAAQNKIVSAIIGLIVLAASYSILLIALNFLGFDSFQQVFTNVQRIE